MRKPLLWLIMCITLCIMDLCFFVMRSLQRDWLWAGIDWACAVCMGICAMSWGYRLRVAYKWRHRHEH